MKKRLCSILLALVLALAVMAALTLGASAAEIVASGECGKEGDNLTWTLDAEGVLTISGEGEMADYTYDGDSVAPWKGSSVKEVMISEGVTSIGEDAFDSCTSLTGVIIPGSVTSIGYGAFYGCVDLTSVIIPSSVTSLKGAVFHGCWNLKGAGPIGGGYNIEFGWTESIPDNAFDSSGLTSVTIPDSITCIGCNAFSSCDLTAVTIPEGVTSIEGWAFNNCKELKTITIPANVATVGAGALGGCLALSEILVDPANNNYQSIDGVLLNRDGTTLVQYPAGKSGETYAIPDNVICIEEHAFSDCDGLTNITISGNVVRVGSNAFFDCDGLTSVTISEGVTYMGGMVFSGCDCLKSAGPIGGGYNIEFGWTKSIPEHTFSCCDSLTSVTIPKSVTSIGSITDPFVGCETLTDIYYGGGRKQWRNVVGSSQIDPEVTIHYALDSCTVTYHPGIGTGEKAPELFDEGETLTLPGADTFTAPAGKVFKAWSVNGAEYAPGDTLTVTGDLTVTAVWEEETSPDTYTVTFDPGEGSGTMEPQTFKRGEILDLRWIPGAFFKAPAGKEFKAWSVNGKEYGYLYSDGSDGRRTRYTVTSDLTVTAVWDVRHLITATAGEHGTVTPDSCRLFEGKAVGDVQWFEFQADRGYYVEKITVDGQDLDSSEWNNSYDPDPRPNSASYLFHDFEKKDHTISATFRRDDEGWHTVTASAGEHGTVDPAGTFDVYKRESKWFTILPDEGYKANITLDGVTVVRNGELVEGTLPDVTENMASGWRPDTDSVSYYTYQGDPYAGRVVQLYLRDIQADRTVSASFTPEEGPEVPPPEETEKKLEDLAKDLTATGEEIRKALESMSGDIAEAVKELGGQVFDKIEELEKRLGEGGSATVEVEAGAGFLRTDVSVTGAKLNFDYSKTVTLKVGKPENPDLQVPESPAALTRFSMKLVEGKNNNAAELTVPIRVTLPAPVRNLKPQTLKVWHYHGGRLVPVTLTSRPFQKDGQWYVSFMVEGFSDFIMTYEAEAEPVTAALSPDGKRVEFTDPAGLLAGGARVLAARYGGGRLAESVSSGLAAGESAADFTKALSADWRLFLLNPKTGAPLCGVEWKK